MTLVLRLLLIAGSLFTLVFVIRRIRAAKLQIEDSIFWLAFSVVLLIISVFPRLVYWGASLLGIQSPTNMVFLIVIFILTVRVFSLTMRVSVLDEKLKRLAQSEALDGHKKQERGK
ncbi:MAG: DUF2304 domain-containing protein [Oscillospiraceae bacterium]|nr:DUF2304 domain-containing protein [Oscillospiraceae bacterium]